jgi:hypothetical protein
MDEPAQVCGPLALPKTKTSRGGLVETEKAVGQLQHLGDILLLRKPQCHPLRFNEPPRFTEVARQENTPLDQLSLLLLELGPSDLGTAHAFQ